MKNQQTQTTKIEFKRISELCDLCKGKKVKSSKIRTPNSVPYLLIDTLRGAEPEFFTEDKNYTEATPEDILIVADGAVGVVGTELKGAIGSTILRMRVNVKDLNKDYLTYFLKFNFQQLKSDVKGSSIPHLKIDKMLEMKIRKPSLNAQSSIVSTIETQFTRLDETIKSLKTIKQKIEVYKKAVLKKAFERGEETELGKAFEIVMGQSPKSQYYNKKKRGLPFFQGKKEFNYKYPNIEIWTERHNKEADKGYLLVSIRAPIGPCNIAPEKCAIGRGIAAIKAKNETESLLLYYLIKFNEQKLDSKGTGTTFKAISKSGLNSFMVKIPNKEDWKQIVQEIESKFSIIDEVEEIVDNSLKKSEQLKKSILKCAFEGRLVKIGSGNE